MGGAVHIKMLCLQICIINITMADMIFGSNFLYDGANRCSETNSLLLFLNLN